MVDRDNARQAWEVSRRPTRSAGEPPGGYAPHSLFPMEDDGPEHRDIQFISFRRRQSDGQVDHLAEDIPASEIATWADVVEPWGGGEYKAIGKNKHHRIVAWYPEKKGEFMLFDLESKHFTLRGGRYHAEPPMPALAAVPAPAHAMATA